MVKWLIIIFIFLSFITQTITEPGTNAILSRIVPSDLFGALALFFGASVWIKGFSYAKDIGRIYQCAFLTILSFFLPFLFSLNILSTLVECLILFFLLLCSVLIFQIYKNDFLDGLVPLLCYTAIVATILGVYDLAASMSGLPRIFPARTDGEALSGFRDAGQAGAYYLVFLTILFPLRFSRLYKSLTFRNRQLLQIAVIFSVFFLALTGKIAAYIGFAIGIVLYAILRRNIKAIILIVFMVVIGAFLYTYLDTIAPAVYARINYKYESRINKRINPNDEDDEDQNDFIQTNYGNAMRSFEDRPLIGSGIGAFSGGAYGNYEVHSTYLKMLGETGLIGATGYSIFLISFMLLLRQRKHHKINPYSDYLYVMYPFIIGCLVSWIYTYHFRKREFWILVSVLAIVNYQVKQYKKGLILKQRNLIPEVTEQTV